MTDSRFDIIVAGAGNAALSAAEHGARGGGLCARPVGKGIGLIRALHKKVRQSGVEIFYESPAHALIVKNDAVCGRPLQSPVNFIHLPPSLCRYPNTLSCRFSKL